MANQAAELLYKAFRGGKRIDGLPDDCRPGTPEAAYAAQRAFAERIGEVAGWKVGASSPTGNPRRAPLPSPLVKLSPTSVPLKRFAIGGIEAEIAVRLKASLPPRTAGYTQAEVAAAIGTVHAGIEVLDSRYRDWQAADELSKLADLQNNGLFVLGEGIADWQHLDLENLQVALAVNGQIRHEARGGNPAGNPLWLVHWLANILSEQGAGLRAGDIVTTGSCTGIWYARNPADITVTVERLGDARLRLEG